LNSAFRKLFVRALLLVAAAAAAGIAFNLAGGIPLVAPPRVILPDESRGEELPDQDGLHMVGLEAARRFIDEGLGTVVDARSPEQYAAGHLPGAIDCHAYELEVYLPKLLELAPLDRPLLLYCNGEDCEDSRFLAQTLDELGYRRLYIYEGGFSQWSALGLPVDGSAPGAPAQGARLTLKRALDFSRYIPDWVWHLGEILLLATGLFVLMLVVGGRTEAPVLVAAARLAGVIFVLAALHKIASPAQFARIVDNYRLLAPGLVNLAAIILPWIELTGGLVILTCPWRNAASLVLFCLTALFIVAITINLLRGIEFDCGCFGSGHIAAWRVLLRDVGLLFCCLGGIVWKNERHIPGRAR